jgi:arginine decarboxylase
MSNFEKISNQWSIEQSRELYHVPAWSDDYVDIDDQGQVIVKPTRTETHNGVNLIKLTQQLQQKGLALPVLVRFSDILKDRVNVLINAFNTAMKTASYSANYTAVYPIKVNQQRRVIEDIVATGQGNVGLEAGSKPELLIDIAFAEQGSTIICNGYKDREYIRLALIARQLGFKTYLVIEKLSELELIVECAQELDITPLLGLRVRLSSIANSNWQNTGGEKSKFGLHANQVIEAVSKLQKEGLINSLELLHFHIGSQVTELDDLRTGLNEGARYYAQLKKMSVPINTIDIGGGLGVDYEGTRSTRSCSMDYTIKSYAETVIKTIQSVCMNEQIPCPSIITESGRAMTAHHAMLITNIIDVEEPINYTPAQQKYADVDVINKFYKLLDDCEEKYVDHYSQRNKDLYAAARICFANGELDIQQWALVEELYYAISKKCLELVDHENHDLLNRLRDKLADKYFCNFSLFQSMPDSWAIDQIFPILPLQRLDEKPDRRCTIQDLTCDSDGRVDSYVDSEGVETSLPIHSLNNKEPYLVGIFLLGAYQEILGDIHNLFGDTASVNVDLDSNGEVQLNEVDFGDKVSDLFQAIHIDTEKLQQRYNALIEQSDVEDDAKAEYLEQFIEGLDGYTYLED